MSSTEYSSATDEEVDNVEYSPPTSPTEREFSPPSSQIEHADCCSSDSDENTSPVKRRKYDSQNPSRNVLIKRIRFQHSNDEQSDLNLAPLSSEGDKSGTEDFGCDDIQLAQEEGEASQNLAPTHSEIMDYCHDESHSPCAVYNSESGSESAINDTMSSITSDTTRKCCSSLSELESSIDDSEKSEGDSHEVDFLYDGSLKTTNEAVLDILKLYIAEKWSKRSLDKNVKLIKDLLPEPNELPSSSDGLFKLLKKMTSFCKEKSYFFCSNCEVVLSDGDRVCCNCRSEPSGIFYELSLKDQVRHMFEQRNLASYIDLHKSNRANSEENHICDIQDGSAYKLLTESTLTGPYDLVLLTNTDGVSLSSSSKKEFWGIVSTICELPPKLRPSFVFVSAIYVDRNDPNMNLFLKPFVDSLKEISYSGGISWVHPESKMTFTSKIVSPILSADAPAKAMVLKVKRFNARFGCNVCEQKAVKVKPTAGQQNVAMDRAKTNKKERAKRRFVFQEDEARLRSGARMEAQGELAMQRGNSRKGVIGSCIMSESPSFDRALCVCFEYMHTVLLGVVKHFLNLIFFVKGPWFIGRNIEEIDEFISQFKVPDFIKRLPRKLSEFKYFKASEFRALLLYYSLPIFQEFLLPDRYIQHWLLLVGAMHILLSECISEYEFEAASIMLRCFVRDVKNLYGEIHYTYNTHNLLHAPILVQRWGPLWSTSAFMFESFNGFVKKQVHGTKHLGKELMNNIITIQNVYVLENIVKGVNSAVATQQVSQKFDLLGKCFSPDEGDLLKVNERLCLERAGITNYFHLYKRAILFSEVYTTREYDKTKKRANSFIQFNSQDGSSSVQYGEILHFVRTQCGSVLCLIDLLAVQHVDIFFHEESRYRLKNLVPFHRLNELVLLSPQLISEKLLLVGKYLCKRPNSVEINL